MTVKLYNEYFQKSKVFCYPFLGISRDTQIFPAQTFMSWEGKYDIVDARLICHFANCCQPLFENYSKYNLEGNAFFEKIIKIADDQYVYVFNFSENINDWNMVLLGRYSKLSKVYKDSIINYFEASKSAETIKKILMPKNHYNEFAALLNVSPSLIAAVGEVVDAPDLRKEEFLFDLVRELT